MKGIIINLLNLFIIGLCFGLYYHSWLIGIGSLAFARAVMPYDHRK